jgi:hypothetical protein
MWELELKKKKEQIKSKASRRKEIIHKHVEIIKWKKRKTIEQTSKTKATSFKFHKTGRPLARLKIRKQLYNLQTSVMREHHIVERKPWEGNSVNNFNANKFNNFYER